MDDFYESSSRFSFLMNVFVIHILIRCSVQVLQIPPCLNIYLVINKRIRIIILYNLSFAYL